MKKGNIVLVVLAFITLSSFLLNGEKPVLYIIGDSTVKNGDGSGKSGQWGWGSLLAGYFDTTAMAVRNHAIGGRSTRTFISDGRWDQILAVLKPGDIVLIQFGHNDSSPLDDTARARGTIKGIGEESKEIYNPIRKQQEVVYSYGWYLRKFIREAREKGARAYICSPVPRNNWKDGKVARNNNDYALWAKQVAEKERTCFIDLNNSIANEYDKMGEEQVAPLFFGDHTHSSKAGAELNAAIVASLLRDYSACSLKKFMLPLSKK